MIAVSITKKFSSIAPFFYILLLLILGLFAFHKTFSLAIFGDEWVVLWNVKNSLVITGRWDSYIDQFIGPGYRLGALMMYFLTESFGTDGKAVYIFSFITRFLAASSLFYFLKRRQCSYPVSFVKVSTLHYSKDWSMLLLRLFSFVRCRINRLSYYIGIPIPEVWLG